jgi:cytochrome oxidase Cu insertion factor (SCO1/SenC/PrrC family)
MKYLKYLLAVGLVVFITSSYTSRTSRSAVGVEEGNIVPGLKIQDKSGNEFKLSSLKGQKVVLTLWAAYDAKSHLQHVLLTNALKKSNYPVELVSVSFDQSKPVFESTLKVDGIGSGFQFVDTRGSNSAIYKEYRLKKGFKSFLIDENGLIMLVNPTPDDLNKVFNEEQRIN